MQILQATLCILEALLVPTITGTLACARSFQYCCGIPCYYIQSEKLLIIAEV